MNEWINKIRHIPTVEYYLAKRGQITDGRFLFSVFLKSQKYTKWEEQDTKDHILHDSINIKCPGKRQIYRDSQLMVL